MTITGILSIFVMAVGLFMYVWARVPEPWKEVGRIMFFCGLLVALMANGAESKTYRLGGTPAGRAYKLGAMERPTSAALERWA